MSITAKALWYLESHLSGDTSLETVAEIAGVSHFHLSRAFGVSTGYSLSAYVRARRLSGAAKALVQGAPDILAIAMDAGYGSHEAFTRAFRQHFGLTPEQLRARASLENLKLMEPLRLEQPSTAPLASPRIVQSGALLIFGLNKRYSTCESNAGMPSQWDAFLPHFAHIPGQVGKIAYGVIHNSDDSGIDYLCGVEVTEFPRHPPEFSRLRIPPQTYAVFDHRGHISAINSSWQHIWNQGLAASGHKATDGPAFERYGEEFDGRTGLGGMEIWLPVNS